MIPDARPLGTSQNQKALYHDDLAEKYGTVTVYALLNSSLDDPLPTVPHCCSGPIASITKCYNKFKQNRLNAEHNVSLSFLCVCSKRPMKLAHQQICFSTLNT